MGGPRLLNEMLSFAGQYSSMMAAQSSSITVKYTLASITLVGSLTGPGGMLSLFGQSGTNRKSDGPVGIWRGESKCVVRPSACNDETALYRIAANAPDRVVVSAGKIVNGREASMGSSECSYLVKTHLLDCSLPNGSSVHLEVKGDTIDGTYTLRDGSLWRKISLHRAKQK